MISTILDRYIIKELVGPFFFGIAAFSCILAGSTVLFHLIGEAVKYSIPISQAIQLFLYRMPGIIVYTFPMSMLLATIISIGRLNSDLEIIAFRAGGISFIRLVIPVFIFGCLVSLATIWFNESIVPKANYSFDVLLNSFIESDKPKLKRNVNITEYNQGYPVRTINVAKIEKDLLKNITVLEYNKGNLERLIRADAGKWIPTGGWEFYDGIMHNFPYLSPQKVIAMRFKKETIDIQINPYDSRREKRRPEEMSVSELKKYIEFQKKIGHDISKHIMHYHLKFSIPFASLIFAILGASVGLRPHRSTSAFSLGISLVVIIIYYILLSIGMGLGLGQTIPPIIAAWLPNIIIGSFGIYLLKKIAVQ